MVYRSTVSMLLMLMLLFNCHIFANGEKTPTDWPGHRGPNMDNVVDQSGLLAAGGKYQLSVDWKIPLGSGYSAISVVDGIAVTMYSDSLMEYTGAFDTANGKLLWRHTIDSTFPGHFGSQDGPVSTPLIYQGSVFCLGPRGQLFALDLKTGKPLWQTDIAKEHQSLLPFYGFSTSPIPYKDMIILQNGGTSGSNAISAFTAKTGKLRWSAGSDTIAYQSPSLLTLNGKLQLLAPGNKVLYSIDPDNGKLLWEHAFGADGRAIGSASINIIPIDDNTIFMKPTARSSSLFRINPAGSDTIVQELWKTSSLKMSYVIPVHHKGYLYGYNGRFLSCVEVASGKTMWKSRPPGDGFPIVIDDYLLIATKKGFLSLAPASPEGYEEVARFKIFDDLIWNNASFAGGHLYLRSLGEMARVSIKNAAELQSIAAVTDGMLPDSEFGQFVAKVSASDNSEQLIDNYMAAQKRFPIIEGNSMVHFVYRGKADDMALTSDLFGGRTDKPMHRAGNSDLFYYSANLEPNARITYRFMKNFETTFDDSLNTDDLIPVWVNMNRPAVTMPEWKPSSYVKTPDGPRGSIDSLAIFHKNMPDTAHLEIYLPPNYANSKDRYPLAYWHGGNHALNIGKIDQVLDNMIADGHIEPLIIVFIPSLLRRGYQEYVGELRGKYSETFLDEIVPMIDKKFRVAASGEKRAHIGSSGGGHMALFINDRKPDLAANLGLFSVVWEKGLERRNEKMIADPASRPLRIYLSWGTYDSRSPNEGWNGPESNRTFARFLKSRGYRFKGGEVPEAGNFGNLPHRLPTMLKYLFPIQAD